MIPSGGPIYIYDTLYFVILYYKMFVLHVCSIWHRKGFILTTNVTYICPQN